MIIYIVTIILIFVIKLLTNKTKNSKLNFCIITGIILYLLIALKDPFLGESDTKTIYYPAFNNVMINTMQYVINRYMDESILFYVITKLITYITQNVVIYYAIIEIPLIFATSKFIYKYSNMPALSFIMFFSLQYYFFNFIALKNSVALGFLILAIDALIEEKNKKYIFFTALAGLFHITALILLILYPIRKMKITTNKIILLGIITLITIIMKDKIFDLIFLIINTGRYSIYSTRVETISLVPFIINIVMLIFSYIITNKEFKKENQLIFLALWIGTIISAFTIILAEFSRIAMYFSVVSIILVPNGINTVKLKNNKTTYYFFVLMFLFIYCFGSVIPNLNLQSYSFFWNNSTINKFN